MKAVHAILQGRRYVSATLAELLVSDLDADHDQADPRRRSRSVSSRSSASWRPAARCPRSRGTVPQRQDRQHLSQPRAREDEFPVQCGHHLLRVAERADPGLAMGDCENCAYCWSRIAGMTAMLRDVLAGAGVERVVAAVADEKIAGRGVRRRVDVIILDLQLGQRHRLRRPLRLGVSRRSPWCSRITPCRSTSGAAACSASTTSSTSPRTSRSFRTS